MRKENERAWVGRLPSAKSSGFGMPITSLLGVQSDPKPHQLDSEETGAILLKPQLRCRALDVSTIAEWCKTGRLESVRSTLLGPRWITLTPEIIAALRNPIKRRWKHQRTRHGERFVIE